MRHNPETMNHSPEVMSQIISLVDSTQELSQVLAIALASSPPWELSPDEMNALTDLSYQILTNIDALKKDLARVST